MYTDRVKLLPVVYNILSNDEMLIAHEEQEWIARETKRKHDNDVVLGHTR